MSTTTLHHFSVYQFFEKQSIIFSWAMYRSFLGVTNSLAVQRISDEIQFFETGFKLVYSLKKHIWTMKCYSAY